MTVASTKIVATVDGMVCRVTFFSNGEPIVFLDGEEIEGEAAKNLASRIAQELKNPGSESKIKINQVEQRGSGHSQSVQFITRDDGGYVIKGDVRF